MKNFILMVSCLTIQFAIAQAPNISYSGSSSYPLGTAISPLIPNNSGGAITTGSIVSTFAGSGSYASTDGTGNEASFAIPAGITVNRDGNLYVTEFYSSKIKRVTPAGVVTTFAGNDSQGSTNGTGTDATFVTPYGIKSDASGNLYIVDLNDRKIRKITPAGVVTTFAGSGTSGSTNGTGTDASFDSPHHVAIDNSGNLYVTDTSNNIIRKITPAGVVTTFAGSGTSGSTDGTGTDASFNEPTGIAIDESGNIYVTDSGNNKIRKITSAGIVTTFAGSNTSGSNDGSGTSAKFDSPQGIIVDAIGNLYVADGNNNKIRKITPAGVVTTYAGNGESGSTNGTLSAASFNFPSDLTIDASGDMFINDAINSIIRKITTTGYRISPALPTGLSFNEATGVISGTPTQSTSQTTYTITAKNASGSHSTTVAFATQDTPTTPTFTQVGAICSGASLSALPTTSNNSITGTWSPAINNTATTTYTFTPTSGQNATTASMTITVNANATPTFTQVAPICSGASLSALPTTSNNSITGTWSPAVNNTATTTYTFTPTAGQCATTASMTIVVNAGVTPTFTQIAPICSGKRFIAALPTKSNNGIAGVWSPALNNSVTTTYTFTPNSGNCPTTMTIVVNPVPSAPSASNQNLCLGSTVANLAASGTAIQWYNSDKNLVSLASNTPLTSTNYYASQTVNGCESNRTSVAVSITNAPSVYKNQVFGFGAKVANLVANGTNLKWYDVAEGGTALASNNDLTTKTYYVSQTINCESPRTAVAVSVVGNQFVDTNSTIANLFPSGDGITWYNVPKNGSALATNAPLTTATYYFTQTIGGVETARAAVQVVVNNAKIEDAQCGITLVTTDTTIKANIAYPCKFEITSEGFSTTYISDSNKFNFATISGITNSTTYSVRVAPLVNGSYFAFGEACTITSSSTTITTKVIDAQCGATLDGPTRTIQANAISLATQYRFEVNNGSTSSEYTASSNYFKLTQSSLNIQYNTTYTIRVAAFVAGSWTAYGAACTVKTPVMPNSTKVKDNQCGITLASPRSTIYVDKIPFVIYRYEVTKEDDGTVKTYTSPYEYFALHQLKFPGGVQANTNYVIKVATFINGDWSDYGSSCTITSPSRVTKLNGSDLFADNFEVMSYPNPFNEGFNFIVNSESEEEVNIIVFDMVGKQIENRTINVSNIDNSSFGNDYAAGVYNVIVSQGGFSKTLRVIKK